MIEYIVGRLCLLPQRTQLYTPSFEAFLVRPAVYSMLEYHIPRYFFLFSCYHGYCTIDCTFGTDGLSLKNKDECELIMCQVGYRILSDTDCLSVEVK